MRTSKKIVSLVLAVMMVASMIVVGTVSASATTVAKIGDTPYESLEAAFAAAVDGDTITVLTNCEGNGMIAPQGKFPNGLTVDFGGYTYTVSGTPVGSTGTESIGFQLLKGNTITFKNGTITGDMRDNPRNGKYLLRMIQNYSDLTLDGMTVSMIGYYLDQTTMATANGTTVIKNSTISAPDFSWGYSSAYTPSDFGCAALNEGTFQSYESVSVTITDGSVINGDVKIDDDNNKPFTLNLEGGTINGGITLDENAQAAMDDTSVPAAINKNDTNFKVYVAKIGDTYYEKVTEAFAAAQDGDKIDIIGDSAGAGVFVAKNTFTTNGIKVDFHEHTYTIDTTLVGSVGYETQAFHLEQGNKITLGYGTITSKNAKMLVQNYSDLTLNSMTLTPENDTYTGTYYTLSNNCGNVVVNNSTINANPYSAKAFAFDVCRYASYPSVNVTVTGNSVINGDVEISASKNDAKEGFSLTLESGTMTGEIKMDASATKAMDTAPEKVEITKAATFDQNAPTGYIWENGTTLVAVGAEITGFQNKAVQADAEGNGIRILTKVNNDELEGATYGYVVAKVTGKDQATANFANLKKDGGNGEKTIDCTGTFNSGIDGIDNNYVTLAVNGMADGDKVAVRFFVTKGGKTYYAKYVNTVTYDGIIATYAD